MRESKNELVAHADLLDFDGCLLPSNIQLGNDISKRISDHNNQLLSAIKRRNKAAFTISIGVSASSRQSQPVDKLNEQHSNASSFRPLRKVVEDDLEAQFYPFLLADAYATLPWEQGDGHAFKKAIEEENDNNAFHQKFLFDEPKIALTYTHVHQLANNLRNCDFLRLNYRPTMDNLKKIPVKSNAAYLLCNKELFYINKITGVIEEIDMPTDDFFDTLDKEIKNDSDTAFYMPYQQEKEQIGFVDGITLSEQQLAAITEKTNHTHRIQDYPLVIDMYDDLDEEILFRIYNFYDNKKFRSLIPKNVVLRLTPYSVSNRNAISGPKYTIKGTGDIDLKPKDTLLKLSKMVLGKDDKQGITNEDIGSYNDSIAKSLATETFETVMKKESCKAIINNRTLARPTVSIANKYLSHAPTHHYATCLESNDYVKVNKLLAKLRGELWTGWFSFLGIYNNRKRAKIKVLVNIRNAALIKICKVLLML